MGEMSGGWLLVFLNVLCTCCYAVTSPEIHVLRARCYSYCLSQYTFNNITHVQQNKDRDLLRECKLYSTDCNWCLHVCDRKNVEYYYDVEQCRNSCKYCFEPWCKDDHQVGEITHGCTQACDFINNATVNKAGKCVKNEEWMDDNICNVKCKSDFDCSGIYKCCSSSCGYVCQRPDSNPGLPSKPKSVDFVTKGDGSVVVKWQTGEKESSKRGIEAHVYLIQYWKVSSPIRRYRIATKPFYRLIRPYQIIHPGTKVFIRLASINMYGSSGFTNDILFTKVVKRPSKPLNLRVVSQDKYENGTVDVVIKWQTPRTSYGLKIRKYLIYWVVIPSTSTLYLRQKFSKRTVTAGKHRFVLPQLLQGRQYLIQVRAVVSYNKNQKKGRPASLQIHTSLSLSSPASSSSASSSASSLHLTSKVKDEWNINNYPSEIYNITVIESYFHENHLKALITWKSVVSAEKYMIFWKATDCQQNSKSSRLQEKSATSHRKEFELYNLQFRCNYIVRIHPVDIKAKMLNPGFIRFKTPYCSKVPVKGNIIPDCTSQGEDPGQPKKVQIKFQGDMCSQLRVLLNWNIDPWKIDRYYVVLWGASVNSSGTEVLYTSHPHQFISSGNVNTVILSQVEYETHYTVQISIQTESVIGLPVIRNFVTPKQVCNYTTTTSLPSTTASEQSRNEIKLFEVFNLHNNLPSSTEKSQNKQNTASLTIVDIYLLLYLTCFVIFYCN